MQYVLIHLEINVTGTEERGLYFSEEFRRMRPETL